MPDWLGRTAPGDFIRGGDEAADVRADKEWKGASGPKGQWAQWALAGAPLCLEKYEPKLGWWSV